MEIDILTREKIYLRLKSISITETMIQWLLLVLQIGLIICSGIGRRVVGDIEGHLVREESAWWLGSAAP